MRTIALLTLILLAAAADRGDTPLSISDPATRTELIRFTSSRALVIGVSRYRHLSPLPGVADDVPLVKSALESQGFSVQTVIDPTADEVERGVKGFISRYGTDPASRLVVYFAGHGTVLADNGYLLAVDTPADTSDADFISRAVAIEDLRTRANQARSRHILMACDSCFSGSLFRNRDSPPANVIQASRDAVRLFITAGAAKETVPDRSVFRMAFVEALTTAAADADRDGYVLGSELFLYLRKRVIDAAEARRDRQTPQWKALGLASGEPVGDVVFTVVPGPGQPASAALAPQSPTVPAASPTLPQPAAAPSGKAAIYAAAEQLEKPGDGTVEQRIAAWEAVLAAVPADELARTSRDEAAHAQATQVLSGLKPQRERLERRRLLVEAERLDADPDVTRGQRKAAWQRVVAAWQAAGEGLTAGESAQVAGIEAKAVKAGVEGLGMPAWASATGKDQYGTWADLTVGGVVQRMRLIKAGTFTMGSPVGEAERVNNETQHQVTLTKDYWLGDSEVTQSLWQAVVGNNPSRFQGADLPVEQVSWDDCQGFFGKLNGQVRSGGFNFPSEAQWEYACRTGTTTAFSFGVTITPDQVNYDGNDPYGGAAKGEYREKTVRVKSLPANAWGLHEMHGNVWEWCGDWLGDYPAGAVRDPSGPASGSSRVLRGGSWSDDARDCRAAYRSWFVPGVRLNDLGFRLSAPVQAGP
ncbi:hypothetical protein LBMAG53_38040 [Planctomycetota bacterium]|nr:hypothetical protein LBMAG53_38040 [Planctomycetota bacterium]